MLRPYGIQVRQGTPGTFLYCYLLRGAPESQKSRRDAGATKIGPPSFGCGYLPVEKTLWKP
jgi:hypothetical protein